MDEKLKAELISSMTDLKRLIKSKNIKLKEAQLRVRAFNNIVISQKLNKLAAFYPREEKELPMLGDHISSITLKGLEKL